MSKQLTTDEIKGLDDASLFRAAMSGAVSEAAYLAETARRKASTDRELKCAVSVKGGVSVSGLNAQFPVTLYADQWMKLAAFMPTITAFCEANAGALPLKTDDEETAARKASHPLRLAAAERSTASATKRAKAA